MHNCKATRETLIALALRPPDQTQSLPAEVEACATCREEYAALRNALRIVDQSKQSALPAESFWPGYHARLRQLLETGPRSEAFAARTSLRTLLANLFTSSVRVPIPLAAALLVFLGVSLVFALNSRRSISAPPPNTPPTIVTRTVEVPVPHETIREKVVNRVVYRERNRSGLPSSRAKAIAGRQSAPETPISLSGFKPTNEVKLTIIKGSYRDEK